MIVQDIVFTRTAEYADVVFPSSASWCEAEGTVTNSERRVQRVRKALEPPGQARDDTWILGQLALRLGYDWGDPTPEQAWDELRTLSPMHAGMRYDRLEALGGIQWPCPTEDHPGTPGAARAPVGRSAGGAAGAVLGGRAPPALRGARRRLPDAPDHGPAPGVVQHGRADEPVPLAAAPRRGAPASRPRTRSGCWSRRARSSASRRGAARSRPPCASTAGCGRASAS